MSELPLYTKICEEMHETTTQLVLLFFTLVTGPGRSLGTQLIQASELPKPPFDFGMRLVVTRTRVWVGWQAICVVT